MHAHTHTHYEIPRTKYQNSENEEIRLQFCQQTDNKMQAF